MKKAKIYFLSILSLALISCASQKSLIKPENYSLKTDIITIPQGQLQGIYNKDKTVQLFAGIPYAKPPVGDLRWKEPQDPEPWNGIYNADHFGPEAMQTHSKLFSIIWNSYYHPPKSRIDGSPMSEDCLYLNIWKPDTSAKNLPVLVYIHGGSLTGGQSFFEDFDGENMAKKDMIVVTFDYRVNVFGFFACPELAQESPNHTTGNYGLLDMVKALEWVNKNISFFGGNPQNVTIAGESAGSSSVSAMCASPLTKNYFQKAIGESSSVVVSNPKHTFRTMDKALEIGENIKKEFKAYTLEELRTIPAKKLVKTKYLNNACTVDGYVLPQTPYEIYQQGLNHEKALLNGFNRDEAFAWVSFIKVNQKNYPDLIKSAFPTNWEKVLELYPANSKEEAKAQYRDIFTTVCFSYPHQVWSDLASKQKIPVYKYCFTKQNNQYKAHHTGEIMYAYDNIPVNSKNHNESDYKLEAIMSSYWANFIKTGNPNGEGLPEWQEYSKDKSKVLELGEQVQPIQDPFWDLYPYVE